MNDRVDSASESAALRRRHQAAELAASLPPLLVAAERVASTVAQGVHGRRRVGQGETFWQFRQYEPGDPPQRIDWRQSAKSDRVFVRELEWEAAQSVWLWCDASASMSWHSLPKLPDKYERAALLSLALAALLVRGGERVGLLGSGLAPGTGRSTLRRMANLLEHGPEAGEVRADGLPPFRSLPRYASLVLVGDFLAPIDEITSSVERYAQQGVRGHLVQVLDPAEESLPYRGRVRFEGLEREPSWLLSRVEGIRDAYFGRLHAQRDAIKALCQALGWHFTLHHTDKPPQTALLSLYSALSEPGR